MLTGALTELVESTDFLHSMMSVAGPATATDLSRRIGIPAPECCAQLHRLAALGVVHCDNTNCDNTNCNNTNCDNTNGHETHYRVIPEEVLRVVMATFA